MAVAHRSSVVDSGSSAGVAVSLSAAAFTNADQLVFVVSVDGDKTASMGNPGVGWTQLINRFDAAVGATTAAWYKVKNNETTVSVSWSGVAAKSGALFGVFGTPGFQVSLTTFVDDNDTASEYGQIDSAGSDAVYYLVAQHGGSQTAAAPANMTATAAFVGASQVAACRLSRALPGASTFTPTNSTIGVAAAGHHLGIAVAGIGLDLPSMLRQPGRR